jgi:ABC-2 type transport system ATP-binding protein
MSAAEWKPLVAQGLCRAFGSEQAVVDVDLELLPGQIHALVGLNGAGKSTLMKLILGMLRPDAGRVAVFGVSTHAADSTVWARVGHLIETPFAYPELTVAENLHSAARLHGVPRQRAHAAADSAIHAMTLDHWRSRPARALSLGNRQRLGLAAALVHDPALIVLDEPTNALDPVGVVDLREILRTRAHRDGAAILVSSHHLDEVARVADRITVIHGGRIVGGLTPGAVHLEQTFFDLVLTAQRSPA